MQPASKKKKRKPHVSGVKAGMPPGTMVFIGERKQEKARIDIMHYSADALEEPGDVSVNQCRDFARKPGVLWVDVNGIHDVGLIETLGKAFDLHPITMEDIVNTTHRPKVEEFPDYLYIVLKTITFQPETNSIGIEQVSLVLGKNFVISFRESESDIFSAVRGRIRSGKGRIRSMKSDYLAYSLMDMVVDHYFLAVERIGDRIEEIDETILTHPESENIKEIHRLKRVILSLRKAVWPLREEIGTLEKSESEIIQPATRIYLRDLYDHTVQIIDMAETFRDILIGMHDTYLSGVSNRMNEIMKVLTIIATIFIPLTFIAGVYGMNFQNMPELEWTWGYYIVLALMLAVAMGLLVFFRRRKWI